MIYEFPVLPSTNLYMKENAASLRHGDIVVARRQTRGRGRMGRAWFSDEGGLYFSVFLKPANTAHLENITQGLCLAVCRAVEDAGVKALVKWPNDVLANGAKIAGILSEAVIEDGRFFALVLGAGVNIRQHALDVPGKKTTTLAREGAVVGEKEFLNAVLQYFFSLYGQICEKGFSFICDEYISKLAMLGDVVCVDVGKERLHGTFLQVTHAGRLLLELDDLTTREISIGDMA